MYGTFYQLSLHVDVFWPNSLGWDVHVGFENDERVRFLALTIRHSYFPCSPLRACRTAYRQNNLAFAIWAAANITLFPSFRADAKLAVCPRKH